MTRTAKISLWGGNQAVRLPADYCRKLGLAVGDEVNIDIDKGKLILYGNPLEQYTLQGRKKSWDGRGSAITDYDWGEDVGAERWEV